MTRGKRILVHDYSGHPFQVQLSRCLAKRGHQVRHVYSASFQTPKGDLSKGPEDSKRLDIVGVSLGSVFRKDGFIKRRSQEIEIGRQVAEQIRQFRPDIVLSSNAPLDTQAVIHKATRSHGARFVFWLQDLYSEAIGRILRRKLPVIGGVVAMRYHRLEFDLLRRSDHIIAITDDFLPHLRGNGIVPGCVSVVENWAPLGEPNANCGAVAVADTIRAVYAGTLGYKHNPDILLAAAKSLPVAIEVFSEGRVAEDLARRAAADGVSNLRVLPWVSFSDLPRVLGRADVLIAMIEVDAGAFSVPSKVLTYLGAGKPVIAAIPRSNLARRILEREQAGLVSDPGAHLGFIDNLRRLAGDGELRKRLGANGRAYAEANFNIDRITDRFEGIFDDLILTELRAI
ncbi:glycosyltransferase family 4 protein [Rhizobium sp. Root1220]|uniref:glycosyltransferase family 4 protein n=1 Tax=Rhizobium sp. Root1220 TaxID=1736432 RepID=UPI0007011852|nr:glycosyltransferase family 4 protein [Rhizobium sp. Root1220]KQV83780.1 hypothetical protein ASC90_19140 [Rhizobium sp. Root1220]